MICLAYVNSYYIVCFHVGVWFVDSYIYNYVCFVGYYVYTEVSGRVADTDARIGAADLDLDDDSCLTFWYHMYGSEIGELNVYWRDSLVWSKTGELCIG